MCLTLFNANSDRDILALFGILIDGLNNAHTWSLFRLVIIY